jgi:fluoroacetyl-CoA thioesterase
MKSTLAPGISYRLTFKVPESKTVPNLYPEATELQAMPAVFATGFMIGLMEWTCVKALEPHLDAGEGSVGIHVNVSHLAATPPGLVVTVDAECTGVQGRRASFRVRAHDGVDLIGEGDHDRAIVAWDRFNAKLAEKRAAASAKAG